MNKYCMILLLQATKIDRLTENKKQNMVKMDYGKKAVVTHRLKDTDVPLGMIKKKSARDEK